MSEHEANKPSCTRKLCRCEFGVGLLFGTAGGYFDNLHPLGDAFSLLFAGSLMTLRILDYNGIAPMPWGSQSHRLPAHSDGDCFGLKGFLESSFASIAGFATGYAITHFNLGVQFGVAMRNPTRAKHGPPGAR
jgi:hypothetical protein